MVLELYFDIIYFLYFLFSINFTNHKIFTKVTEMHELEILEDGKASMMFSGQLPWHQLGTNVGAEDVDVETAIKAASLDWEVNKKPLFVQNGRNRDAVAGHFALVRSRDNAVFGVVSDVYQPLQNVDAFRWFDEISSSGKAKIHTAGSLKGGKVVWILAKVDGVISIANNDDINKYILLTTKHDGTGSVDIKFTPVRVVCNNTLTIALSSIGVKNASIKIAHIQNMDTRLNDAKVALGIISGGYSKIEDKLHLLAETKLDIKAQYVDPLAAYLFNLNDRLFSSLTDEEKAATISRSDSWKSKINEILDTSPKLRGPEIQGSLYQGYNAVTEFYDHHLPMFAKENIPEMRMNSMVLGRRARIKNVAFEHAVMTAEAMLN